MEAIPADVWVLTETRRDFSPRGGYELIVASADAEDREWAKGECWVAIWSRVDAKVIDMNADPERTAGVRLAANDEHTVLVIGTVLPWLSDRRWPDQPGSAGFATARAKQAAEWEALRVRHDRPTMCVAGDVNQDLAPRHYYGARHGRSALRSVLAQHEMRCLTADENDPVRLATNGAAASLDHICVAGSSEVARVAGIRPAPSEARPALSDHYGVWAQIG